MFDMLASKLGEAQAFADGIAANLDVINMDRLLEEQEREENSKGESLRLLRTSGDATDAASFPSDSAVTSSAAAAAGRVEREDHDRSSGGALGEVEMPQLGTDAEQNERSQRRSLLSSPNGDPSESGSFRDRFASLEDGGGNFEDEFDPILASIRKPPQQQQQAGAPTTARQASPRGSRITSSPPTPVAAAGGGERKQASPFPNQPEQGDAGRPSAGSTLAASFLSMLPGDMRAKAGEVMAQSSARITESANAFRSAMDHGGAALPASEKFKRRQSDPTYGGSSDLEEGRGGKGAGRRAAAGDGDEDEVRLVNVDELLSEEERQQLAAFSGGAGGAGGRVCGWRRLRKYIPVFVGIGLLGLFYLWRWTTLLVGSSANDGVESLGPERM